MSFQGPTEYSPHISQIFYCAPESRHWCGLRWIPLPVLRTVAGRLCRVSTQLHPRLCPKPTPALNLRSLATNFVRYAGQRLENMIGDVPPRFFYLARRYGFAGTAIGIVALCTLIAACPPLLLSLLWLIPPNS